MSGSGPGDDKTEHPTQKPVAIFAEPIRNHLARGEAVYDPFAGSGTAFIAAEIEKRVALGVEIEPRWCDAIAHRFEAFTGITPEREGEPISCAVEPATAP